MASSPITGYIVVLQYTDRSGLLGAFGPYPTEEAAAAGIAALKLMPMVDGNYETLPIFGVPGAPEKAKQPVYRPDPRTAHLERG
jgi:hypothetical protein